MKESYYRRGGTEPLLESTIPGHFAMVAEYSSIEVVGTFFSLTYVHNDGAAFGLDLGGRWSFIAVTILVAAFILKDVNDALGLAPYVVTTMQPLLTPESLPAVIFATMALVSPLSVPLPKMSCFPSAVPTWS